MLEIFVCSSQNFKRWIPHSKQKFYHTYIKIKLIFLSQLMTRLDTLTLWTTLEKHGYILNKATLL